MTVAQSHSRQCSHRWLPRFDAEGRDGLHTGQAGPGRCLGERPSGSRLRPCWSWVHNRGHGSARADVTRILRRAGLPRLAECDPLSVVHRRENAALRGDGHADVGVRILAGAVSAGHTQVPGLRPALHVLNGEFARVSLASLLEQG